MNIQTTNWKPNQTTIEINTGSHQLGIGDLFAHEGRIWRAMTVAGSAVTAEWIPNADVARSQLPSIIPLVPTIA